MELIVQLMVLKDLKGNNITKAGNYDLHDLDYDPATGWRQDDTSMLIIIPRLNSIRMKPSIFPPILGCCQESEIKRVVGTIG